MMAILLFSHGARFIKMFSLIRAYQQKDPSAKNFLEILLLYPGVRALFFHRIAHTLYLWHIPFFPRLISEISRFLTGIEIHPGAVLGKNVVMDHGMGIVIGETAVVGDNVLLYHGVTLGSAHIKKGKRHPTLESGVIVGAGSKILGNISIGHLSRVGANSVVLVSVPDNTTVAGIPAQRINTLDSEYKAMDNDYQI